MIRESKGQLRINEPIQSRAKAKQRKGLWSKEDNWSQDREKRREKSSYKEHRVDAQAPYADEGRGKLRKATGSRKQAPIRRRPNGETRQSNLCHRQMNT